MPNITLLPDASFTADFNTSSPDPTSVASNQSENALQEQPIYALLALFSLVVVTGNLMVIVAVAREMYLRTVTNYFLVSLAVADVMVGGVVMPFSISNMMTSSIWLYGQVWCDLWRGLDVLASTASIMNLCAISLDRFWAITDPIAYPRKLSNVRVCMIIALVWFFSAAISFPGIIWWHAVSPPDFSEQTCFFTEDSAYLILSSTISFYLPTFFMMFFYFRIYRAALAQRQGIESGSKVATDCPRGDNGEVMFLRIHRGGYRFRSDSNSTAQPFDQRSSDSDEDVSVLSRHSGYHSSLPQARPTVFTTKKFRHFAISKKITKLAREQKAAKTLGIVMGVFIICWVPFFVTNILFAICHRDCVPEPEILFSVVTWLGYINSGINPIIYALSMKDFRRAFRKMIFCCPRYRHRPAKRHPCGQSNSISTSSFSVSCGDRCSGLRL